MNYYFIFYILNKKYNDQYHINENAFANLIFLIYKFDQIKNKMYK